MIIRKFFLNEVYKNMRPEGFQRATGKPFGRVHRRDSLCLMIKR